MRGWLKRSDVRWGLLSIACPIITVSVVIIYQSVAHADFWNSVLANTEDDANRSAAALMAISEVVILTISACVACVAGLSFASMSMANQRKLLGIGALALLVNGTPLVLVLVLLTRGGW